MAKPILLSVDDDSDVLRAIERDLRSQYGAEYRVMGSDSPEGALDLLKQLKVRNDSVALLLADQRMPRMDGVEFLREATRIFPEAKRALLTAYADTNAAISAINEANINYFFLEAVGSAGGAPVSAIGRLARRLASFVPAGLSKESGCWVRGGRHARTSCGTSWRATMFRISGSTSNFPPTIRKPNGSWTLLGPEAASLPVVLFPDGTKLLESVPADVAQRIGLRTRAQTDFYDLAIVGGGPAGLAAAVYGASEGLHTVMIEREAPGGQAGMSSRIENYLGFPNGLSGGDLARRAVVQAQRFGVEILSPQEAVGVRTEGPYRIVKLADGNEISCHALMIATGVQWRRLEAPGIDRLQGAGVYYGGGATEALSCKGEIVYVVGGANSAGQAAMNFAKYRRARRHPGARRIALQHHVAIPDRPDSRDTQHSVVDPCQRGRGAWRHPPGRNFRALFRYRQDRARAGERDVHLYWSAAANRLAGGCGRARRARFPLDRPRSHAGRTTHPKGWTLDRDPFLLETNVPGIFAVGDVRHGSIKRVASGVGEGSVAVQFIHQYLSKV